jgi:ferredoxin-NADP reductase/CRP-like cAMP-binding protein
MMDSIEKILIQTGVFNNLEPSELQTVINNSTPFEFQAGDIIANEGEDGSECYVILYGSMQIFTNMPDGKEIVLARASAGEVIGEQSLLPGSTGKRNASLRAYTNISLLAITKNDFLKTLTLDSQLENKLLNLGDAQIRNRLHKQSVLFQSLTFEEISDHFSREEEFSDGTIIFNEGDAGDKLYLVVSGKVDIFQIHNGSQQLRVQIEEGGIFGELALLNEKPRTATAIAHGTLKVFSIDGAPFLRLYEQSPELRDYIQTLEKIYPMAGVGFSTQHLGRFMDVDCLITVCVLANGESLVSSRVIGINIFNMVLTGGYKEENTETIIFRDTENKIDRELILSGTHIVGVTSRGPWPELGKIYRWTLEKTPITPAQKKSFQLDGVVSRETVLPDHYQDQQILCNCLQIKYGQIRKVMLNGVHDVNGLVQATGAGSVCGSCRIALQTIVGEVKWIPVQIKKTINVSDNIRSFRLKPIDGNEFTPAKAGQHLLIQGRIENLWVQRPYTISSAEQERDYREITVKKEVDGVFSNWLFNQGPNSTTLSISEPEGDFVADFSSKNPIVCLVSGIGVTPALSICRSLIQLETDQKLYIDYSASTQNQFIYRQELEAASERSQITVKLRTTQETGRLTCSDIRLLVQDYPDANFFICGTPGYQKTVKQCLAKNAIPDHRLHFDHFKPVGGQPVIQSQRYFYLGLLLTLAFGLQNFFEFKWPWLESIQKIESYRIGSGLFLAFYIAGQFILPVKRWQGKIQDSIRHYQWHKLQGAFAPLVFYIHSTQLGGYAYLKLLIYVYFANFLLGLFNHERITNPNYKKTYLFYWLPVHVLLSVVLVGLIVFHAYIALAY